MRKYLLEIVVFLCGAVVMTFEIVGSRVMGPYLGTSIFIWTSLIGVILGSLSLGYWLGGRMADRNPTFRRLAWILFLASLFIGFTTIFKDILLNILPRFVSGLKWQSVISALFLFAPASIFLGMVSPYAVRLKIRNLQTSGSTVGNLYAISTVGSIAGTFASGFLLIPLLGTDNILYSQSLILVILSIILYFFDGKAKASIYPIILLTGLIYLLVGRNIGTPAWIDVDTQYSRVWVYDAEDPVTGKPVKFMRINNESSSAMFLDSDEPVFPYARYYRLAEYFHPGFHSALLLGGAACTYATYFLRQYPESTIDVVEIDPELTRLARKYFRLKDDPRMRIIHEDARTYLNRMPSKYDVIFGDTFKSLYELPWHLTTLEAAGHTYDMLNEGGVVMINIISPLKGCGSQFLQAEMATYEQTFPHVLLFAVDPGDQPGEVQSVMLVALKSDTLPATLPEDPDLADMLGKEVSQMVTLRTPVLTDDHAPVDYYINKAIR